MEAGRPTVFIGSSTEGKKVAQAVQLNLRDVCDATLWDQGMFELSSTTIESLVSKMAIYDFAVLVLTPDDLIEVRGRESKSARDNVLVEAGLAIGFLGRERTFIVHEEDTNIKIPSDLAGVKLASWRRYQNDTLRASLAYATNLIAEAIERLGSRPGRSRPKSAFIAVPMNAFNVAGVPENYLSFRTKIRELIDALKTDAGLDHVYCAIEEIEGAEDFDIPSASLQIDEQKVKESEYFVLVLIRGILSKSVLIEMGMAISLGKKCLIFAQDGAEMPYVLRNVSKDPSIAKVTFHSLDDLIAKVRRNGRQLLQF